LAVAPQIKDIPPLSIRAAVDSINEERRTVDLVFSTGAAVERFDWWTGKRFIEKLSLKPSAVRLDRLNAGGPLLDAHSSYSIADQIGTVEPGSARISKGEARATVRFSRRDAVEPIWNDVRDGILKNVSVGYRVHKFEEDAAGENKIPIRTAIDWEPFEISMVPMPADSGAQVREHHTELNSCELVTRSAQEQTMNEQIESDKSQTVVERNPLDPGAPINPPQQRMALAKEEPADTEIGANLERDRITGIMDACRAARIPGSMMDKLIADKTPLLRAQTLIFEELRKRGGDDRGGAQTGGAVDVRLGPDPMIHVREGIQNALLHRLAPQYFKLEDVGKNYRGLTMLDIARLYLQAQGVRVTDMSKMELAGAALGLSRRGGMHTTSDYADLLADVANKTLRRAYEEQPQTFAPLGRRVTIPDFKLVRRVQIGDAPALLEVNEHGEFTHGTIGEGKEEYQLATYGRIFAITRQALINDDTDAFARVPTMFGRKARILESNLAWLQITSNPTMGDGNLLFSTAHANLATAAQLGPISVAALGYGRASMRNQTSLDGDLMNLSAQYLLVPPSLETVADQYVTLIVPNIGSSVNPFMGRLTVIAEPRLEAASSSAWYLAASAAAIDILEFGYLEGQEGPMVESRVGFDVDGVEIKARLDFAAKVIDWRGLYTNQGTGAS
jgi:Caudovirus prohead serine protease